MIKKLWDETTFFVGGRLALSTDGLIDRPGNSKTHSGSRFQSVNYADRTGLEPATSAVTGRHSNQLNYRSNFCNSGAQDNKISTEVSIKIPFLNLLF